MRLLGVLGGALGVEHAVAQHDPDQVAAPITTYLSISLSLSIYIYTYVATVIMLLLLLFILQLSLLTLRIVSIVNTNSMFIDVTNPIRLLLPMSAAA